MQKAFRDRPMSPLDIAIFWTEYVIRHGGAMQMRSAAMDLYWFQYLLLDVIAVIVVSLCLMAYLLYKMISVLCSRSESKKASIKQKKNK